MAYSNSSLVSYTKLTNNHYAGRKYPITRITPHCVVGQCSVETLGNVFYPASRRASCQYGIGSDGRIGMYVEEKNASWCSSSYDNDNRAVTIECASDTTAPYAFRPAVYDSLVKLCADICRRNGKTKLLWLGSKEKALAYTPKSNEMVLTCHRFFANKSCPGGWMYARMGDLANKVNALLGSDTQKETTTKPKETATKPQKVTRSIEATTPAKKFSAGLSGFYKTTDDLNVRNGAGIREKILGTFPTGTSVRCYGYYNLYGLTKWYFVTGVVGTTQYIGYVNSRYLKKS